MSMGRDYVITTDSGSDLPITYLKDNQVGLMSLSFTINGQSYRAADHLMEAPEFYRLLSNGLTAQTSQATPLEAKNFLELYLKEGLDVLHIAFSSALSGTCSNVMLAASELREQYPERNIVVVDSLCASLGQGLFVHKAVEKQKSGADIMETAQWLEEHKQNVCHYFTVKDLFHLYRGGRVTKATAFVGSVLNIKPILKVDDEGRLIQYDKVRGRKHSIAALVDHMEKNFTGEDKTVFVSHGDCPEDLEYIRELIKERLGLEITMTDYIGPTIGTHSGPGTLALFFMGRER